ncbi:hypothetical protein [Vibrio algivorus]|uniref:Uncharacterized protein n=1 Tax=Vibrio algivorus TaxID=1667024 RepID=A0ABQ6EMJ5_9VIBR|nr:hypothetical protein [Vibrio algivorus]GLT14044.1 hypothetical protein GCM10007931_10180 [Vibrio algivorus]
MKTFKNIALKTGAVVSSIAASSTAFAADYATDINAAVTDSSANYTLVVAGVISVAAIGFGAGLLIRWLNK